MATPCSLLRRGITPVRPRLIIRSTASGWIPRLLFYYDFQPPNWTNAWSRTMFRAGGTTAHLTPAAPAAFIPTLRPRPARSRNFIAVGAIRGRRHQRGAADRGISTAEWNFSQTNWTFSGWFRCESMAANNYIFYVGNGNGTGGNGDELVLYGDTGHNLILKHWNTSSVNDLTLTASGVVNTGVWNQVAITYATTNGNSGNVQLYFNGVLAGSQANEAWNLNQSLPVRFGAHAQSPSSSRRGSTGNWRSWRCSRRR